MDQSYQRKPVFLVDNLETLRIITDPIRMQIIALLNPEPQTVNQVAEKMGLATSRLYYHFNLLEEHGLIRVVMSHMVKNIVEKYFWLTAEDIDFDKSLLDFSSEDGQENVAQIISSSLEATHVDIMRSLQARKITLDRGAKPLPRDMVVINARRRLKDETYQQFLGRLKNLINEFSNLPDERGQDDDINYFSLACYVYPNYYYEGEEVDNKKASQQ